jgi:uncharacterized protein
MPAFVITCIDRTDIDTAPLREGARAAHMAHVEAHLDRYLIAGPLKDAGGVAIGSLLLVEAADEGDARTFLDTDPYASAGFWGDISIHGFLPAAGIWIGGVIWKPSVS